MNDGLNDCPLQSWTRLKAGATFGLQYGVIDSQNRTNKQVSTTALVCSSRFHRQYLNPHKASIFNDQIFLLKTPKPGNYPELFPCKPSKAYTLSEDKSWLEDLKKVVFEFSSEHRCRKATPSLNIITNFQISLDKSPRSFKFLVNKKFLMGHEKLQKGIEHPWTRSHNVALRNRKNIKRPSHT